MALRLYANSLSPFVRKVRIALYEKAAAFETIEIDRGSHRAELLRINPRGEVPALVDAGIVVCGSAAICDYLEDTHPRPALCPVGPAARARCRSLEHIADTHTDGLQFLVFLVAIRRPELREAYPTIWPRISEAVRQHYMVLDRELNGREHFVEDLSRVGRKGDRLLFLPHGHRESGTSREKSSLSPFPPRRPGS